MDWMEGLAADSVTLLVRYQFGIYVPATINLQAWLASPSNLLGIRTHGWFIPVV